MTTSADTKRLLAALERDGVLLVHDAVLPSATSIVVGRPVAAVPGFDYSPAMKRFAERNPRWTAELIGRYAADPEALVPGTSMAFHGMPDPAEREALIDYLESLGG